MPAARRIIVVASLVVIALAIRSNPAFAQTAPYRLDSGDVLAVVVDGVLGSFQDAPINLPRKGNDIIAGMGHPVPVREDGTVALPKIDPIYVRGLSVLEAHQAIEQTYLSQGILQKRNQVMVNLMRKRTIRVTVVTNKYPNAFSNEQVRTVDSVNIQAADASPLSALAASGGAFDASNILVLRRPIYGQRMLNRQITGAAHPDRLREGDIVKAPLPEPGYFFAGGQLNPGRYRIPNTSNLTATQALAQAGAITNRYGAGPSQVLVTRNGITRCYDRDWLLHHPNAVFIRPGDVVTLRQSPADIAHTAAIDILRYAIILGL